MSLVRWAPNHILSGSDMTRSWLDPTLYPFEPRFMTVDGERLHYLDEGEGDPILFIHGTPTWSFLWRDFIKELRGTHRCIAPDHLGFGLSDKPAAANYTPQAHAERLALFIETLDLENFTLVVHDFGGPIGLSYALKRPEAVRSLFIMNTWLWSNEGNKTIERANGLLKGPVGNFLYKRLNFSARVLLKAGFADKTKLTKELHAHYLKPFDSPAKRSAPHALAKALTASNDWYASLWEQRYILNRLPMTIAWGMKDSFFPPAHLERWQEAFPNATVTRFEDAGHFLQEEVTDGLIQTLKDSLNS